MSYQVVITREAEQDLIIIVDYLNTVSEQYVTSFLDELESYTAHLSEAPELFIRVRGVYRRLYMKRFRYHMIFTIEGNQVRIIAVVHESRHPERWIRE